MATVRIEGADPAEVDRIAAALLQVLTAGSVSGDFRNRERTHGPARVPGVRRYLTDVTVLTTEATR